MKIIGLMNESRYGDKTFLAEVTSSEMAMLAGWPTYDDREKKLVVNSEIEVAKMYSHLREIANAPRELQKAKEVLEAVASLLQLPAVIVEAAEAAKLKK